MASDLQQTPFVKQLAASDRPTREKALESLQTYLASSRNFTTLDLLKIWKGLFFCVWQTDRPRPQQSLCLSLSHLLLPLPQTLFLSFLHAFWTTISTSWNSIQSLRLDKFLLLVRCYVRASFSYLSAHQWDEVLVSGYLEIVEQIPLSVENAKVPDGLRYHVLDVWVQELDNVDKGREGKCPVDLLMAPLETLRIEGRTKTVRTRAKEMLEDERLKDWNGNVEMIDGEDEGDDWEGFEE